MSGKSETSSLAAMPAITAFAYPGAIRSRSMISSTRRSASGRTCEVGLLRRLRRLLHLLGDVLCLPGPFLGAIRDRLGVRLLLRLLVGLDVVLLDLLIFDFDPQRLGGPPRFLLRDEVVDGRRFFRVGVVVRVLPSAPIVLVNCGISAVASSLPRTTATVLSSTLACFAIVRFDFDGCALRTFAINSRFCSAVR